MIKYLEYVQDHFQNQINFSLFHNQYFSKFPKKSTHNLSSILLTNK